MISQVPLALVTVITPVVELIVHPVLAPALKDTAPVPLPPEVVAVPVEPKVMLTGTDSVKADWLAWAIASLTVPLAAL